MRAADANGDSWGAPIPVDITGNAGYFPSPAVINGIAAIGYCDNISHELRYVQAADVNSATWGTPLTLDSGQFNSYSSLADVNGLPCIAFEDYSGIGSLRFTILAVARYHIFGASTTHAIAACDLPLYDNTRVGFEVNSVSGVLRRAGVSCTTHKHAGHSAILYEPSNQCWHSTLVPFSRGESRPRSDVSFPPCNPKRYWWTYILM